MYPHDIIPGVKGINMYIIMICVGLIVCFLTFSKLSDKLRVRARIHNLALIGGVVGIGAGLGASVLFQALYNIASTGRFEIVQSTGATFYGGLIGGAAAFLLIYFIVGRIRAREYYLKSFFPLVSCIAPAIAIAHGFGRIGCLFAGCCHGKVTDSWCGIMMYGDMGYEKYVPVQLFEAIFLFLLCAFLICRVVKAKKYNFSIYLSAYGVWRFIIEYARADYRGSTFISFLTPSQLIAAVLVIVGVALAFVEYNATKKTPSAEVESDE